MDRKILLEAIRCCRENDGCERCPLQAEICDDFYVEMENIPADLMDRIEETLEALEVH